MADPQLLAYIRSRTGAGVATEELIKELLAQNWSPNDVTAALTEAGVSLAPAPAAPPAPAPAPHAGAVSGGAAHSSTKIAFLNGAAGLFIGCVAILTAISILGVWNVFGRDVITKSFETLGLLAAVAIIVVIAGKFIGDPTDTTTPAPSPLFHSIRNLTLVILIASAALLAFLGVLAIWDVVTDKAVLGKALSSLAILAFSSFVIVMVALEREQSLLWQKRHREISGGAVLAFFVLLWVLFTFARWL
jgi:hypothetical protein